MAKPGCKERSSPARRRGGQGVRSHLRRAGDGNRPGAEVLLSPIREADSQKRLGFNRLTLPMKENVYQKIAIRLPVSADSHPAGWQDRDSLSAPTGGSGRAAACPQRVWFKEKCPSDRAWAGFLPPTPRTSVTPELPWLAPPAARAGPAAPGRPHRGWRQPAGPLATGRARTHGQKGTRNR